MPSYEADDLIGTLVTEGRAAGIPSTVVTRDKDLAQLISKAGCVLGFCWQRAK